jgi:hypothetical protein
MRLSDSEERWRLELARQSERRWCGRHRERSSRATLTCLGAACSVMVEASGPHFPGFRQRLFSDVALRSPRPRAACKHGVPSPPVMGSKISRPFFVFWGWFSLRYSMAMALSIAKSLPVPFPCPDLLPSSSLPRGPASHASRREALYALPQS